MGMGTTSEKRALLSFHGHDKIRAGRFPKRALTSEHGRFSPTLREFYYIVTDAGGNGVYLYGMFKRIICTIQERLNSSKATVNGRMVNKRRYVILQRTAHYGVLIHFHPNCYPARCARDAVISAAFSWSPMRSDCGFNRCGIIGAPRAVVTPSAGNGGLARRFLPCSLVKARSRYPLPGGWRFLFCKL